MDKEALRNIPRRLEGPDLAAEQRLAGSCGALSCTVPADASGAPTQAPALAVLEHAAIKGARL